MMVVTSIGNYADFLFYVEHPTVQLAAAFLWVKLESEHAFA